jgi:hypothetical protein
MSVIATVVENTNFVPVGSSTVTNNPGGEAATVTGKLVEIVVPTTYALPALSTAIALAPSTRFPSK